MKLPYPFRRKPKPVRRSYGLLGEKPTLRITIPFRQIRIIYPPRYGAVVLN
jgi:hypothetical protein